MPELIEDGADGFLVDGIDASAKAVFAASRNVCHTDQAAKCRSIHLHGTGFIIEERETAAYIERGIGALRKGGTIGAMLWCYADYDPRIWHDPSFDVAGHEPFFGLWRADGEPKPAVTKIATHSEKPRVPPPVDRGCIDMDPEAFYLHPRENLERLYSRFLGQ